MKETRYVISLICILFLSFISYADEPDQEFLKSLEEISSILPINGPLGQDIVDVNVCEDESIFYSHKLVVQMEAGAWVMQYISNDSKKSFDKDVISTVVLNDKMNTLVAESFRLKMPLEVNITFREENGNSFKTFSRYLP